jgi:predicted CXXCH cytochrome family protein
MLFKRRISVKNAWKRFVIVLLTIGTVGMIAAAALGAYVVFWAGLRANVEPSDVEAVVARTVRNWAIPRRERQERNPLEPSAQNIQAGRDIFRAQCAGCHGYDGDALTPVGRSLYPRAQNLRSALTQALTDGELHYIIENGVPLTGMAAWSDPHHSPDPWKLVLFIRTLGRAAEPSRAAVVNIASTAHYVGSQACASCHADEYRRWKNTPMANIVRDPGQPPPSLLGDLKTNTVFPFKQEQVAFVYGSLWKQRYFTKIGDDYFPLPVQWEVANKKWSKYFVGNAGDWWASLYPPDNMQRPTGPTCDGCHSVGYDIHTKQVAEWNVGCERCHGPGSEHVAHKTRASIVNPARMDSVAANDTCIQCHSQGRPRTIPFEGKYYDWPVGYNVALRLADYWQLEARKLGEGDFYYFADGTAHKNRMQGNDFSQSLMYRRGMTCFDCHDVHGTNNYAQLVQPVNTLCLDCHGPSSPNGPHTTTIQDHTHHKVGSTGSECVFCHMPAIETEGVPGVFVHAHTFKFISPRMTDQYKIPNPCTSCHADKTTSWAVESMSHWPGASPWRVE